MHFLVLKFLHAYANLLLLCFFFFFFFPYEQCFQSPHAYLRKFSLRSINKYIISMPCVSCKFVFLILMDVILILLGYTSCYTLFSSRDYTHP